ncbi:MAG: DRTGG domain-containing protein [Chloroflexota bacterium]|nr:DRTGG domain-containing protein [Chloroflexota bacterium]
MQLKKIVAELDLKVLAGAKQLEREAQGCYIADLLSCVMAGVQPGQLWFTLQTHLNIIAIASMLEVAAIVVTEDAPIAPATVEKAMAEGVVLLSSAEPTYETVAKLIQAGY